MRVRNVISQGGVQDKRKRRKKRSGAQGWKEWEREMAPPWPGSKDTAWWFEGSQETAGKKESIGIRKEQRRALQTDTERS